MLPASEVDGERFVSLPLRDVYGKHPTTNLIVTCLIDVPS